MGSETAPLGARQTLANVMVDLSCSVDGCREVITAILGSLYGEKEPTAPSEGAAGLIADARRTLAEVTALRVDLDRIAVDMGVNDEG